MLDALFLDLRYALRGLRRSPGFAAVAIVSLGLGIGFNAAIFAIVDALLLRPLPVAAPERLVEIYTDSTDGDTYATSSVPDYLDLRARSQGFVDVAGYSPMMAAVNAGDRARLVMGEVVTGNYFGLLGVEAALGRTLLPADDGPGAPKVVVLSHRYWSGQFAADPGVLGRTLKIQGETYDIVGVAAAGYSGLVPMLAPQLFVPLAQVEDVEPAGIQSAVPSPTGSNRLDRRGQRWLFLKGRLRPGVTVETARANSQAIAAQLAAEYPATNAGRRISVLPTSAVRVHPSADGLMAWGVGGTMFAVGLVLLIACANVAGMLLARASARRKEISLRLAIGANRERLVRQFLTESVVLAVLGGAVGVALAWWATRALATLSLPIPIPVALDVRLDWRVLGFSFAAALATGIVAGLAPALRSSRPDLVGELKGGAAAKARGRRFGSRDVLVAGQIAITALLLVSAALLTRSLGASRSAQLGFRADGLAIVGLDVGMAGMSDPDRAEAFFGEAERRLAALPGVLSVARASRLPFSLNFNNASIAIPGHQRSADETGPPIDSADVSPSYFETLGIALLEGRAFSAADRPEAPRVAIVNETMARKLWPGRSALGELVYERTLSSGRPLEIVGVVADHRLRTVGEGPLPAIFTAISQRPSPYGVLAARTAGGEAALLAAMRDTLLELEPDLLFLDNQTMRQQVAATLFPVRAAATLVAAFSAVGLLLAAVGLYGVIAFAVARRTREIGVRLAIGARPGAVLAMILRQGLALAGAGLAVGLLLAAAASRLLSGALYGVSVADPIAWAGSAVLLMAVAALANLIPALRAMRIEPSRALRAE